MPEQSRESEPPEIVARHRGLVARTVLVSALTLFSRVLGFVREVIMAAVFGDTSAVCDAFFTAWRVPNLFRRLFGEGALSTSLQVSLTEADGRGGNAAGRRLFLHTICATLAILLVVCAAAMLGVERMPDRMPGTGWAWLGADPAPVRDLMVRLLPYVVLVCLAALAGGALYVRGHYAAPNLSPVVMNLTWIGALTAIGVSFGWSASAEGTRTEILERQWEMARWLAWGVLAGGVVQLAIHVPPLVRHGLVRPRRGERPAAKAGGKPSAEGGAWRVIRTAAPLALGAAVYQINVMIDGLMAEALLRDGGPSALYYANRVQQFPLALVAIAATGAVFPALKALGHVGKRGEVRDLHDRTQLAVLFLALPAAVGLWVLAQPIAVGLFQHGSYGAEGTARVAAGLEMLALALVPAGAAGLLGRTYIALGDLRTPVWISSWMLVVNAGLNVAFVRGLEMDVEGLTLATAVTSWGNLALLLLGLRRRLGLPPVRSDLLRRVVRLVIASTASGLAAWSAVRWTPGVGEAGPGGMVVGLAAGMLTFFLAAAALGIEEWRGVLERLRERWGR